MASGVPQVAIPCPISSASPTPPRHRTRNTRQPHHDTGPPDRISNIIPKMDVKISTKPPRNWRPVISTKPTPHRQIQPSAIITGLLRSISTIFFPDGAKLLKGFGKHLLPHSRSASRFPPEYNTRSRQLARPHPAIIQRKHSSAHTAHQHSAAPGC